MGVTNEQLKKLLDDMPYKWRVQSTKFSKAQCVAYVDSRQVQDQLDKALGAENWQDDYKVVKDQMFAGIGIKVISETGDTEWIWKWDTGSEANMEAEKSIVSDSFKRAAVKWGIGRFLYSLGMKTLNCVAHTNNKEYPADANGNILWTPEEITNYLITGQSKSKKGATPNQQKQAEQPKQPLQPSQEFNKPAGESALQKAFKPFNYLTQVLPLLKELRETNEDWNDVGLCADIVTFEKGVPKDLQTAIYNRLTKK